MADPLNTLGFCSWGLLGEAEGGIAEKIFVLDLGVDVASEEREVGVEIQEMQSLALALDDNSIGVEVTDEIAIGIEIEDEEVEGESGDLEVGTEVCE